MAKTSLYLLDGVAENLRLLLGSNLSWLEFPRHQAFKFATTVDGLKIYTPNVYNSNSQYLTVTPNNKTKAECYFIFNESNLTQGNRKFTSDVSIIFNVNMKLIDSSKDEVFIEELIDEVVRVLNLSNRYNFYTTVANVQRDPDNVYSEFQYDKITTVSKYPLGCFRINCSVVSDLSCDNITSNCEMILNTLNETQLNECILPTYDFDDDDVFNNLTPEQIEDLEARFGESMVKNLYPQDPFNKGSISGSFEFDYDDNHSWQYFTLTGDVTSWTNINFPTDKSVNFRVEVIQSGSGDYEIDFSGSGFILMDGLTLDDYKPQTGIGTKTTYTIELFKGVWRIWISKDGITA